MKKLLMNKKLLVLLFLGLIIFGMFVVVTPRFLGAQDCTSVEKYDAWRDECYFDCDSDKQCDALTKQVDQELNESFSSSRTKATSDKPQAASGDNSNDLYTAKTTGSETNGTVYTVKDGSLVPSPERSDEMLWNLVTTLIGTDSVKRHIVSFEVFDDQNNDTAASVWRSSSNASQWHMNINAAFANQDKKDLIRTIVHEYGHVITLSGDQVEAVSGACPRIQLDEGCGRNDSYINGFYDQFWKQYGFDTDQVGSISEKEAAELYESEPSSFVSQYASTNITEDIAESFADFVTKSKPTGTSVSDKKVQYFYRYPELVQLRNQIRFAAAKVAL